MPAATTITTQSVGRTFTVAIAILGAGAILQLAAVCWAFVERFHAPPPAPLAVEPDEAWPAANIPTLARLAGSQPAPDFTTDPVLGSIGIPQAGPLRAGVQSRPAQAAPAPESVSAERVVEMLEQGKMLRERGDTGAALAKFREAHALDAGSPRALAEIAMTYEKMGLDDRANEQWKRIYDFGETAGVLYAAAEAKLKAAQATELSRAVAQAGPMLEEAPHLAKGALLGLMDMKMDEYHEAGLSKKFLLHVPIKARPGTRIDSNELVIRVRFFEMVDGARTETTAANVSSRWATAPPDWADSEIEELEVNYELPADRRNRKYFGYLVLLYYKGALQASTGTPDSLMQKYPAPQTLQPESNP